MSLNESMSRYLAQQDMARKAAEQKLAAQRQVPIDRSAALDAARASDAGNAATLAAQSAAWGPQYQAQQRAQTLASQDALIKSMQAQRVNDQSVINQQNAARQIAAMNAVPQQARTPIQFAPQAIMGATLANAPKSPWYMAQSSWVPQAIKAPSWLKGYS